MSKGKTEKMCRCGRGKLLSGERSMFNYKDKDGKQICSECVVDQLTSPFVKRNNG